MADFAHFNARLRSRDGWVLVMLTLCVISLFEVSCAGLGDWKRVARDSDEQALRNNLAFIRSEIRHYTENNNDLPQRLDDLAGGTGKSFNLADPITKRVDWQIVIGENPTLMKGKRGLIDVHSASTAVSSQGTLYNSW